MNRDLSEIRKDFSRQALNKNNLLSNPVAQFRLWLNEAIESQLPEPTAMTLSTVSPGGIPASRVVLLKKLDEQSGFWFYTNYDSDKAYHLAHNPQAALNFFWPALERQVRITGLVTKVAASDSETYFNSRPMESRLAAIASPQSRVVSSRQELEERLAAAKKEDVKRPDNWGGYALIPNEVEFWQGRPGRLHDRIRYKKSHDEWIRERLAP